MSELITVTGVISSLITGVMSGTVAAIVFYIFLLSVRPKIDVSDKICKVSEDESGALVKIKVVNKTRFMLTNVKYGLRFCKRTDEGVHDTVVIVPAKEFLDFIDRYSGSDEDAEYAIRYSFKLPRDLDFSKGWLEFCIQANHSFSNTSVCMKKRYCSESIKPGKFETRTSMRILDNSKPTL